MPPKHLPTSVSRSACLPRLQVPHQLRMLTPMTCIPLLHWPPRQLSVLLLVRQLTDSRSLFVSKTTARLERLTGTPSIVLLAQSCRQQQSLARHCILALYTTQLTLNGTAWRF